MTQSRIMKRETIKYTNTWSRYIIENQKSKIDQLSSVSIPTQFEKIVMKDKELDDKTYRSSNKIINDN